MSRRRTRWATASPRRLARQNDKGSVLVAVMMIVMAMAVFVKKVRHSIEMVKDKQVDGEEYKARDQVTKVVFKVVWTLDKGSELFAMVMMVVLG